MDHVQIQAGYQSNEKETNLGLAIEHRFQHARIHLGADLQWIAFGNPESQNAVAGKISIKSLEP